MRILSLLSVLALSTDAFVPSLVTRNYGIRSCSTRKTSSSMVIDPEMVKNVLIKAAPWVIGYGVTMTVLNNMPNGANMMNFPGSNDKPGMITFDTSVTMDDVAGIDHIKNEIEEVLSFLKNPEKYDAIGAKMIKGILLISAPGNGKTLLARAMAGEAGCPLLFANGAEFVNVYVGNGPKRVRELFETCRKQEGPCILFIDEIDSLLGKRGSSIGGNDERDATLNQFLSEMDGMNRDNDNILVIGATNMSPSTLDQAAVRPGRFDRILRIDPPNRDERLQVLNVHAKNKKLGKDVDLEKLSKLTPGMSPASLANVLNEAAILAVRNNRESVSQEDLEEALEKAIVGIRLPNRYVPEKIERLVAVHEMGHALVGILNGKTVSRVSCIPSSGGVGGYTLYVNDEDSDRNMPTRNQLLAEIRSLQGGRVAEQITFGKDNITTGASSDLERVNSIASAVISDLGMGDSSVYISAENEYTTVSLINQCYDETVVLLEKNLSLLGELVEGLLEKRDLNQEEFYELVDKFVKNGGELKK